MSQSIFRDYFIEFTEEDLNFEISNRGGINFEKVSQKIIDKKVSPFIIDISINGYTNNDNFDFSLGERKWSEVKKEFKKGDEAQKDPEALTVKRAIRLCAKETSAYIKSRNLRTNLSKYYEICPSVYAHLGGHFVVDKNNALNLLKLWENFDDIKGTKIKDSIARVLRLRFPEIFVKL